MIVPTMIHLAIQVDKAGTIIHACPTNTGYGEYIAKHMARHHPTEFKVIYVVNDADRTYLEMVQAHILIHGLD